MAQNGKISIHFITYLCGEVQRDYIKDFENPDQAREYIDDLSFDIITIHGGTLRYGLISPCLGYVPYYARVE